MEVILIILIIVILLLMVSNFYLFKKSHRRVSKENVSESNKIIVIDPDENNEIYKKGIEKGKNIALNQLYWEYYADFLEINQRGIFTENDIFLLISFQLKFSNQNIGSPIIQIEYINNEKYLAFLKSLEEDGNEDKFKDEFEEIVKKKIEYVNLCSSIKLEFIEKAEQKALMYNGEVKDGKFKVSLK